MNDSNEDLFPIPESSPYTAAVLLDECILFLDVAGGIVFVMVFC